MTHVCGKPFVIVDLNPTYLLGQLSAFWGCAYFCFCYNKGRSVERLWEPSALFYSWRKVGWLKENGVLGFQSVVFRPNENYFSNLWWNLNSECSHLISPEYYNEKNKLPWVGVLYYKAVQKRRITNNCLRAVEGSGRNNGICFSHRENDSDEQGKGISQNWLMAASSLAAWWLHTHDSGVFQHAESTMKCEQCLQMHGNQKGWLTGKDGLSLWAGSDVAFGGCCASHGTNHTICSSTSNSV